MSLICFTTVVAASVIAVQDDMDVSSIPSELIEQIRFQFEGDARVQQLRVHQGMAQRSGNFKEAMALARTIETLFNNCVYEYMKEAESQVERVDIETFDIPQEAKDRINTLAVVLFMCTDIIETAVMDIDDVIHKYDKDMAFEMFEDISQLSQMAKAKLKFFQESSGYMKDLVWADKCDNMYEVIQSKAKSIIRKRKSDPNWGKNKEAYK